MISSKGLSVNRLFLITNRITHVTYSSNRTKFFVFMSFFIVIVFGCLIIFPRQLHFVKFKE